MSASRFTSQRFPFRADRKLDSVGGYQAHRGPPSSAPLEAIPTHAPIPTPPALPFAPRSTLGEHRLAEPTDPLGPLGAPERCPQEAARSAGRRECRCRLIRTKDLGQ